MAAAEWVAAGAACVLALTSIVAVFTWRENRRRDREVRQRENENENEMSDRILSAARREFRAKDEVGGLKSTLIGIGVVGLIGAALVVWDKLTPGGDK